MKEKLFPVHFTTSSTTCNNPKIVFAAIFVTNVLEVFAVFPLGLINAQTVANLIDSDISLYDEHDVTVSTFTGY
ncbi:CLUMA_CG014962, isoform A [Clunio marinus]|uniref:CLUMA_CG014962, isoform A n=1 Tax=Clunio marinus TaxID=568069 RepID=A0A1J1IPU9_9DIPT|nr:CLUMA_CG014962, isoform A [Clunio marinus]